MTLAMVLVGRRQLSIQTLASAIALVLKRDGTI